MSTLASLEAKVHGRVQGVYFRAFVSEYAIKLGLMGHVRNLWGGEVEVRAEGEKATLEKLLRYLKIGPPEAQVERVEVHWSEYTGAFHVFEIRH